MVDEEKVRRDGEKCMDMITRVSMIIEENEENIASIFRKDFSLLREETLQDFVNMLEKVDESINEAVEIMRFSGCPFVRDEICMDCKDCRVEDGCRWWSIMKYAVSILSSIIYHALKTGRSLL